MRIGFSLLNNQGIEDVQALVDLARRADDLGFDSVWVHDHVFNVGHVLERIGRKPYYEPLTLLSFVAACTTRVRLGTSVLVLPYHNPIRLAKAAATLDVLSGGRLILGVGVGAIDNEMEAMGTPFKERGAFTDEAIAVMRALWTAGRPALRGAVLPVFRDGVLAEAAAEAVHPGGHRRHQPRGHPARGPGRRRLAAARLRPRGAGPGDRDAARGGARVRSRPGGDPRRDLDVARPRHVAAPRARHEARRDPGARPGLCRRGCGHAGDLHHHQ